MTGNSTRTWNKTANTTLYARWISGTKASKSHYSAMGIGYMFSGSNKKRISSPYGPRPGFHQGVDLAGDDVVSGTDVIAVGNGTVKYVYKGSLTGATVNGSWKSDGSPSQGYCVSYEIDKIDPVTGKKLIVTVMHLKNAPTSFKEGDPITKGQVLGKVGNTGSSSGAHLHFEVNNSGATWPSGGRNEYNCINPLYFYPNTTFTLSPTCYLQNLYWDVDNKYKQ